ncbi:MAG: vitamin B12 dependent methionine synthase, activation domain protein [Clostridiales bacterium]|nr:vitamin B12 dependent methionine synthase, activation domain protein [Clostridiales bacterium]
MELTASQLNEREILRYLGCSGEPPEELLRAVREGIALIAETARPRQIWRLFDLEGAHPVGTSVTFQGEDIRRHLQGCDQVILMAATLGPDVETLLLRAEVRDMAQALVLDCCASAGVEAVCDRLEGRLRAEWREKDRYLTDRFSPGYGDFPIGQQPELCRLLDTQRRIGLSLTSSGIMVPRKSVTAVLGIADTPRHRRSQGCLGCAMYDNCAMRKGGTPCGGQ